MRKTLLLFIVSTFLLSFAAYAQQNDINVVYNSEGADVTVSFMPEDTKMATLLVLYPDESGAMQGDVRSSISVENFSEIVVWADFKTSTVDLATSFPFKLSHDMPAGYYKLFVNGMDFGSLYFAKADYINELIQDIKTAPVENYDSLIYENSVTIPLININYDEYISQKDTINLIIQQNKQDIPDGSQGLEYIKKIIRQGIALGTLNSGVQTLIPEILKSYWDEFSITIYSDFNEISNEVARLMLIHKKIAFGNLQEVKAAYEKSFVIARVNSATRETIKEVVNQNNSTLMLNFEGDYTKVSSAEALKALVGEGFNSVEEIQSAFNSRVNDLVKELKSKKEPTGSGGGSKRVAMVVTPLQTPVDTYVYPFTDTDDYLWAKGAIQALNKQGIISGVSNTLYAPADNLTREQFCKLIVTAFGFKKTSQIANFDDVKSSEWYYQYVDILASNGIIKGKGENRFGVGESITEQDVAVILYRVVKALGLNLRSANVSFDITGTSEYAEESLIMLTKGGIITGFIPQKFASRATAAVWIYALTEVDNNE